MLIDKHFNVFRIKKHYEQTKIVMFFVSSYMKKVIIILDDFVNESKAIKMQKKKRKQKQNVKIG